MNTKNSLAALIFGIAAAGCGADLGECDPEKLDITGPSGSQDGVNDGQVVINTRCVSCHSANAEGALRHGAPFGLNFDVPQTATTERQLQVFNAGLSNVRQYAEDIWEAIDSDYMPPAGPVDTDGKEQVRNWLACGAPAEPMMGDTGMPAPMGSFDAVFDRMHTQCVTCHSAGAKLGNFVWGDGDKCATYDNIVGVAAAGDSCSGMGNYIEPNSPENSILVQKCSTNGAAACGTGTPMPATGQGGLEQSDPDLYNALVEWVTAGAPKPSDCP